MVVETVEDLAEAIADMAGVFGCCKNVGSDDDKCEYVENKPICCRVGLVESMKKRIVAAVDTENGLVAMFGENYKEKLTQKA